MDTVISVGDLSRRLSSVLGEVNDTGEVVVVTHTGRPIAAIVPIDQEAAEDAMVEAVLTDLRRRGIVKSPE